MKKISVIIPCYNMEDYIDRCLDSMVRQTIGIADLEIIVVNDASTDHTLDKLIEWGDRYPDDIKIITYDENLRQGGAMNIGMQYATGEYLTFAGADDWLELDAYESLYNEILRNPDFDFVRAKFRTVYEYAEPKMNIDSEVINKYDFYFDKVGDCFYDFRIPQDIKREGPGEWGSTCTAIYRRSIIEEHDIRFPERVLYEDNYWGNLLEFYLSCGCVINKVIYNYYYRADSTVHALNDQNHLDRIRVELYLLDVCRERKIMNVFYGKLCIGFLKRLYCNTVHTLFVRFYPAPNLFEDLKHIVVNNFPDYEDYLTSDEYTQGDLVLISMLQQFDSLTDDEWNAIQDVYLQELRS
ncbi:MAG: glycosyltransferase [Lachnospiraceae bacterium]|nr:glycosyltransferase [Lachnospiraceae bacterium]